MNPPLPDMSHRWESVLVFPDMFISLGGENFKLTLNQIWWRDPCTLSGQAAVGFGWGLSRWFAIFIHHPHLFTADLHGHIAMSEVPREIFIFQDQQKKSENPFLLKLMRPIVGSSVLDLTQQRNRTVSDPICQLEPCPFTTRGQIHLPLQTGLELGSLYPCRKFWRFSENLWDPRH